MTTLSARYVKRPRARYDCAACLRAIDGPYIRLYGMADRERPWTLRLHPTERCCPNVSGDAKIAAALAVGAANVAEVSRPGSDSAAGARDDGGST
jgi:hypothetical protein